MTPDRATGLLTACAAALLCLPASAPAWGGDDWQVMENPYFHGLTNAAPERARELLEEMDRFRIAVQTVTNARIPPGTPPALVVVFDTAREFGKYAWSRNVAGFALSQAENLPEMTIVVPARGTTSDELQTIRHEYVHALNKHRAVRFPRWYEEGTAEVFSLVKIDGNDVVVGLPPEERFRNLQNARMMGLAKWLSFDDVVSGDLQAHGRRSSDAYAQYWLLTHYLTFGRPDLKDALNRCMVLSDGMMKPLDAFRTAFGTTPEELWQTGGMRNYARHMPASRYTLRRPIVAEPFALKPASDVEVGAVLAALDAHMTEVKAEMEAAKKKQEGKDGGD